MHCHRPALPAVNGKTMTTLLYTDNCVQVQIHCHMPALPTVIGKIMTSFIHRLVCTGIIIHCHMPALPTVNGQSINSDVICTHIIVYRYNTLPQTCSTFCKCQNNDVIHTQVTVHTYNTLLQIRENVLALLRITVRQTANTAVYEAWQ